jgi:hypothetical protein
MTDKEDMGRKSKLTPETTRLFVQSIKAGNDKKVAADVAGIGETTLYRWLEIADQPDAPEEYREFRESLTQAEAEAEVRAVALIRQAAEEGKWQAASWWLERKHNERWGNKIKQEISGVNGSPITISIEEAKKAVLAYLEEGDSTDGTISSGENTSTTQG